MNGTIKVKDFPVAAQLLVAWICDTLDPSIAHPMAGFLISQAGYLAHRLGLSHDMWMQLAHLAWPETRGGHIVGLDGKPSPYRGVDEHDLAEKWFT